MVARTEIRAVPRRGAASALVLLLAVVTSACGGGGTGPGPNAPVPPTGQGLPAETAGFCTAAVDLAAVVNDGPDVPNPPPPPEDVAAAFDEYQARLEPPLTAMEQSVPPALQQDIATIARQARYAVATNDEAPLNTPEYDTAASRLRAFMITECRFEQVRVTAVEYRFDGIPPALPAGTVAFTMSNQGAETHELDVYRINEGVPQPFPELVLLPDDQRDVVLTSVGEISASPGAADTEFMTLIPGRYGVACPVPQGTTPTADGTGPPHAALGMVAEFAVN
ncbi:hypothetical protein FHX44_114940 [Pseudonocardia hierapolitana]|uniref:Lipoprotein n=1 Tax=Pseudonocardia hierapolitana TaxID=1128676 RepID=A0A561SVX3_9PSEU|nr:hypothetical protein [Pseudonocardia hierapolitana]TWF79014.1 hypothetical protein FHX44_114940 [Pseudonocardia hierapolitana]